jgi:hypothetical protein
MTNYVRMQRLQQYYMHMGGVPLLGNGSVDNDAGFPHPSMADILFEQIQFMPKQERARLKKEFPHLPPYVFMTEKEKRVHFKVKSD